MDNGNSIVCLLGPGGSGKSTLLRTFLQCVKLKAHGYAPSELVEPYIKEISEEQFETNDEIDDGRILSRFQAGNYANQEKIFLSNQDVSTQISEGPIKYFFSMRWQSGQPGPGLPDASRCRIGIVDAAGELSTPRGHTDEATEEALESHRVALEEVLLMAQSAVIVVPPADGQPELWANHLFDALDRLARRPITARFLRRVVIVFSKYDRLFTSCGSDAAAIAIRPHTVLYTVRREFALRQWRYRVDGLRRAAPDLEIVFTVASALGFVPHYGNPNFDPHDTMSVSPVRFQDEASTIADPTFFWRPFLTADPFIFAATGLRTVYMIDPDEAVGAQAEENDPPRAEAGDPGHPGAEIDDPPDGVVVPPEPPRGHRTAPSPGAPRENVVVSALKRFFNASGDA